ncbi:MAG: RHS repeat-associated core domain-containing protein, partial [Chloroflexi bacterium]|nr:RHS repeat-associated core domain-containing protein [Chloroflexota bacterium]
MLWYGSRHYDPELGRFIQPDSIVPVVSQGVQAFDRYGYTNN